MSVKIEMEIPENCRECRFCRFDCTYREYYCYAGLIPFDVTEIIYERIRRPQCPLQEVKE